MSFYKTALTLMRGFNPRNILMHAPRILGENKTLTYINGIYQGKYSMQEVREGGKSPSEESIFT